MDLKIKPMLPRAASPNLNARRRKRGIIHMLMGHQYKKNKALFPLISSWYLRVPNHTISNNHMHSSQPLKANAI